MCMSLKGIGALLILAGCGGTGFSIAAGYRREESCLRQMIQMLQFMECELQYRLTPLPELCKRTAGEVTGSLRTVMRDLARELDWQTLPDANSCMQAAISHSSDLPNRIKRLLRRLGASLGRFDLEGQYRDLQILRADCEEQLTALKKNTQTRLRCYQTLGLCAGFALVILLI